MKKTLIAFFVLSVLVAACPVFAVDVSKEPTGFRGIKWDTPVTSYPNTFKRAEDISLFPGQTAYAKIKEKGSFAGHQIDGVCYFFDSVGFASAIVLVASERGMELSIYNDFITACSLQWGEGEEIQDPESMLGKKCEWNFPSSRAVVTCFDGAQGGRVFLLVWSRAGAGRVLEYEKNHMSSESETDF